MPESPEQLYRRALAAADADGRLPIPPLEEWDTFPFEGELRARPLRPPAEEPPRQGEGGIDCWRCAQGVADAIWSDDHWLVAPLPESSGLPVIVILYPREHFDLDGLPPAQLISTISLAGDDGQTTVTVKVVCTTVAARDEAVERGFTGMVGVGNDRLAEYLETLDRTPA